LVVEFGIREDLKAAAERAALRIICCINQPGDPRLNDGAGAHGAGLKSDVESGSRESVIAKKARALTNHQDFRVCGGVIITDGPVTGVGQD